MPSPQLFETLGLLTHLPPAVAAPLIPQLANGLHDLIKGNYAKFVSDPDQWRTLLHLLALSIDATPSARYDARAGRVPIQHLATVSATDRVHVPTSEGQRPAR